MEHKFNVGDRVVVSLWGKHHSEAHNWLEREHDLVSDELTVSSVSESGWVMFSGMNYRHPPEKFKLVGLPKKGFLQHLKESSAKRAQMFGDYEHFVAKNALYYSNALAGEAGEVANIVKKMYRGDKSVHGEDIKSALSDEVADVLIQLDLLCQVAEIDLGMAVIRKFNSKSKEIGSTVFL